MLVLKDRGPSTRAALAQDDRRRGGVRERLSSCAARWNFLGTLTVPSPANDAGEGKRGVGQDNYTISMPPHRNASEIAPLR
ncbi:MAG: hypothetical protein WB999_00315, partial [Candidatus Binataceae bacterium]